MEEAYGIKNPGPNDVLCGRGGGINGHSGNISFRDMVKLQKEKYKETTDKDVKTGISQRIIDHVKSHGGRFLQKEGGLWIEIQHHKAISKTSQALREGEPCSRSKISKRQKRKMSLGSLRSNWRRKFNHNSLYKSSSLEMHDARATEGCSRICGMPNGCRGKILIPWSKNELREHSTVSDAPTTTREKSHASVKHHPTTVISNRQMKSISVAKKSELPLQLRQHPISRNKNQIKPRKSWIKDASKGASQTPPLLPISFHDGEKVCEAPKIPSLNIGFEIDQSLYQSASLCGLRVCSLSSSVPSFDNNSTLNVQANEVSTKPPRMLKNFLADRDIIKDLNRPVIKCVRMHSLATSDNCTLDGFLGNEAFSNPFEDEDFFSKSFPIR